MDNWDGGGNQRYRGRGSRNQRTFNNSSGSNRGFGQYGPGPADYHQQGRGGRGSSYQNQRFNSNWDNGSGYSGSHQNRPGGGHDGRGRGGGRTWGPRNQGGRGRGRAPASEPDDIEFLGIFSGGKDPVTALLVDPSTSQLYTGSKDGWLRTWTCSNPAAARPAWECHTKVDMGGVVDSLLLEGGFMCVGMHARGQVPVQQPGAIKICHLESASQHLLEGHKGPVLALAAAGGMLFSGGQDGSIRAWRLNQTSNTFELGVEITAQQGGHSAAVTTLVPANQFLFSADFHGNIKVWDMASGQCTQSLDKAHGSVITDMIFWENHLLSASLDSSISIWAVAETPAPGAVLEREPTYRHITQDHQGKPVQGGILKMAGAVDNGQTPVLLTSHNGESAVRLWELPSFADRGQLRASDPRALAAGFAGLMFSGDTQGNLKAWRWKAAAMPVG